MIVTVAEWTVTAAIAYMGLGLAFAIAFVARGAGRIDPSAADGTVGFRLAILPGAAALWPFLLRRWLRGTPPPEEHTPHRDAARREPGGAR